MPCALLGLIITSECNNGRLTSLPQAQTLPLSVTYNHHAHLRAHTHLGLLVLALGVSVVDKRHETKRRGNALKSALSKSDLLRRSSRRLADSDVAASGICRFSVAHTMISCVFIHSLLIIPPNSRLAAQFPLTAYDRAKEVLELCVQNRIEKLGEKNQLVGIALRYLGLVYQALNDADKAIDAYERARGSLLDTLGGRHDDLVKAVISLSELSMQIGATVRALEHINEAVDIGTQRLGCDHQLTVKAIALKASMGRTDGTGSTMQTYNGV